ncbi:hypothetical protein DCAR_0416683 [Daucus carota subsp. sativus]|uniref:RING-type E3 ubiquitin transferase n=1 Tax=Daucus carota subsp. sativus TaxID=79200 RepID=A0AAF0WYZ2_DAUCS|nr:PREDICTED: E3 ubiquitin-protein ligase RKP [Daucus carota subsp. sativus]XP_017247228.1 PREDICTED: E3 ubiquitin-protein ligase RKP [Daucus carota subsp. sativus]XP_017247229.1 PREDICTED: E3 ubiquitin-protein ligase RKP [Daucus carota subsp. sativus]WOG97343.1 hypothetical protein DCAR_0416683 [Daucus carota subsp. sativus]
MAEDSLRIGGITSGLAVVLNDDDRKESSQKNRRISYCDDFGDQSVERTLEHVLDLPYRTINPLTCPVDTNTVRAIIRNDISKSYGKLNNVARHKAGVSTMGDGYGLHKVMIEESSVCGDIRIVKPPLLLESNAMFSSARANACVWKGKWMFEVILETSGIQQLGWVTLSCPFTDHEGVGDADDSYAYDGKRVSKWNKEAEAYGQSWVVGDVIGCCIDLDRDEISFYRNGVSLGVAFDGIRKMVPGLGYYPAISLSQGERCELNFGARPFRHPIKGFLPIQPPPLTNSLAAHLLHCFSRLLDIQCMETSGSSTVDRMRRLKRFVSFEDIFNPVSRAIIGELYVAIDAEAGSAEYIAGGPLLSFIIEVFKLHAPHDYRMLDRVIDILLEFQGSTLIFENIFNAIACCCKTASVVITECPYSGSYPYLALVCHMLRREELMIIWWKSDFEFLFEAFLSQKIPNKQDLRCMMPCVWWPGSSEDISYESSMMLTTTALAEAVDKIEEKHRELCQLVLEFIPPVTPPQSPGSLFRTFLQNLLFKNRGADHNMPPPGVSSNSAIVSLYTVILHFLSEGSSTGGFSGWIKGCGVDVSPDVGFLHRGGQQSFPVALFLKNNPHRVDISRLGGSYSHLSKSHPVSKDEEDEVIRWEEGCMDGEGIKVTHSGRTKPCCCSSYDDFTRTSKNPVRYTAKDSQGHCSSLPERASHGAAECSTGSLNDEIADKPSTSDQSESGFGYRSLQWARIVPRESNMSSAILEEEELLDALLLLYHLGLAPIFKQASSCISHQAQSISLLEETDKQIRERATGEQLKRLKEARTVYREELMDCVRKCAWYRISLCARWKQRGMYATCMWIVQLLLILSKMDSVFIYIPEYYLETLVDCFHVLRKSDPPFVPSAIFINQGLASFVSFIVTHFNDPRISSAELKDLLLQSISVLVQYKESLAALEMNEAATQSLPRALLSAFDNRSWIPVTNILLRLCKGSGFGSSKHGESSTSSVTFQNLLREACIGDEELFSAFLNRLFNTLSWAMTEFSVSIREIQEKYKIMDLQQRKCSVIFDLSCNLARVLEFCTREIPQAFLSGSDMNLRRLVELIVFILNHLMAVADPDFIELTIRRPGQSPEKINRGMILAPLAGIILNLFDTSMNTKDNDIAGIFASMDCPDTVVCGFQYLIEYDWAASFRGDVQLAKLRQLEKISSLLICRTEAHESERKFYEGEVEGDDGTCCICYACDADTRFVPCSHNSCFGCISRHLLNCQRCFFCNATVTKIVPNDMKAA